MGRFAIATRAFFKSLFDSAVAEQVEKALLGQTQAALPEPPKPAPVTIPTPVMTPKPARSDALTLLATLQREARFVDFFQEQLDGYADAQIGAAVRDVHRDTAAVLKRLFELQAVSNAEEGAAVSIPDGPEAARYRLTGNVTGQAPASGRLVHSGWEATKCDLPIWTGPDSAAKIIAPAEIEVG